MYTIEVEGLPYGTYKIKEIAEYSEKHLSQKGDDENVSELDHRTRKLVAHCYDMYELLKKVKKDYNGACRKELDDTLALVGRGTR